MDLPDATIRLSGLGGLVLHQVNLSGDDAIVAWLHAASALADAMGIEVVIRPAEDGDGRVDLVATRVQPPPTLASLNAKIFGKPMLVPTPE